MPRDILAGLLPTGDPLAPFDPAAARRAADATAADGASTTSAAAGTTADPMPEKTSETGSAATASKPGGPSVADEFSIPLVQPPPVARRPRRSVAGPLVAGFALLLFTAVGACLYLLVSGMGISQQGQLIATDPRDTKTVAPQTARPIVENSTRMPPQPSLPSETVAEEPLPGTSASLPSSGEPASTQNASVEAPQPHEPSRGEPDGDDGTPRAMAGTSAAEPDTESTGTESTDASEPQWDRVYRTLRSGKFSEMTRLTSEAVRTASTPEQRAKANRLHRLAGLAERYDAAIRSGAARLGAAEVFELVPGSSGITAIVVESSRDEITLKVEGRVKTYSLDSVPLVLAHRLSKFSLPAGDPVAEAARGAYQALWPQATDAHRRQAFQWWRDLEGSAQGSDVSQLEPTVRELFDMPVE